jgi:hypothetical protein
VIQVAFPSSFVSWYLSQYSDQTTGSTTGVQFPAGAGNIFFFSPLQRPHRPWSHPASYARVPEAIPLKEERPGREADHISLSMAEVKNAWGLISTPPIRLRAVVLN